MAWLARLDASAARLPSVIHGPYLALKWLLVGLGVYGAIGLCVMEISEKRVGLGSGLCTVMVVTALNNAPALWRHLTGRRT